MDFDLLFIGAGPAGYEGAIAAAKKGLKTAVVEMDLPGGTCLQRGCIPTKAILHSVKALKQISDFAKIGIHVEKFSFSLEEIRRRKVRIVSKQTRGIELLFKQNNIQLLKGRAQNRRRQQNTARRPERNIRRPYRHCHRQQGGRAAVFKVGRA